ncbi:flagellar protein FlaG [uncultured Desulfobacter sp.]|uniref:flagellar protein FlaG n=1 Tax=uncultured Desulfobacter sp. TaxID=240139 RepID=UPI002AAB4B1D|nr:flagellar protein FlaG [uncultured Desulfobacter sp.]
MDVTAKAITTPDRPETSIRGQETVPKTQGTDPAAPSGLKQVPPSLENTNTKPTESQASDQKNEDTKDQTKLTRKDVEEMVQALEDFAKTVQTRLNFTIDDGTEDVVVKIMDKETDEVIKQFPAEEILELREKMQDLSGLLFSADI